MYHTQLRKNHGTHAAVFYQLQKYNPKSENNNQLISESTLQLLKSLILNVFKSQNNVSDIMSLKILKELLNQSRRNSQLIFFNFFHNCEEALSHISTWFQICCVTSNFFIFLFSCNLTVLKYKISYHHPYFIEI